MPGVEILNTTIHYKEALPTWAIIVMIAVIVIPISLMTIGKIIDNDDMLLIGITSFLIGCVLAAGIRLFAYGPTDKIDYIEHEVLIDDSVSLAEFNEKYEIVSQKGKIYVVREKGND